MSNEVIALHVVLNSGSPLLKVISVTDGIALCEWQGEDGKISRGRFSLNSLSKLVPLEEGDVE